MTIGLLHPGAMGAAVGSLVAGEVIWAGEGRSAQTTARASDAGFRDTGTLAALAAEADGIISLCPPAAAYDLAEHVYDLGFDGIYVDANAVAPATARRIAGMFRRFVDGGVIGPPPGGGRSTRLYLSGPEAAAVAGWFDAALDVRIIDDRPGSASSLKMLYAAWTKGTAALLAAIRAAAEEAGVAVPLLAEWSVSQPELVDRSERMAPSLASKAWRFEGEMHEIAATFESAGLPTGFHDAAADVFARLAGLKEEAEVDLDLVIGRLLTPGL